MKIKKYSAIILLTVTALFCSINNSTAQKLYFGAKVGLNLSNVSARDFQYSSLESYSSSTKLAANLGLVIGYQITPIIALEILPNYSFQGYTQNYNLTNSETLITSTTKDEINLDYLKIPITAKFFIYDGLYAQTGLSLNFLFSALKNSEPLKDLNGFDFSIPIALGYKLTRNIDLSLQYDISTSKVDPLKSGANRNFSINLAWIF